MLTDSDDAVLHCLRASLAATSAANQATDPPHTGQRSNGASAQEQHQSGGDCASAAEQHDSGGVGKSGSCRHGTSRGTSVGGTAAGMHGTSCGNACDWDPEDADSCDELDMLSPVNANLSSTSGLHDDSWSQVN